MTYAQLLAESKILNYIQAVCVTRAKLGSARQERQ